MNANTLTIFCKYSIEQNAKFPEIEGRGQDRLASRSCRLEVMKRCT